MTNKQFSQDYWTERYEAGATGWDIGYASPPLINYAASFAKDTRILIPGAGNGHEALWLADQGYTSVTVVDISSVPIRTLQLKDSGNRLQLIHQDFFEHQGTYELILEQTFFCALDPQLRADYTKKMADLLSDNGILAGVLFGIAFEKDGPPFGGSFYEYETLLSPLFNIRHMEICYNSIPSRANNELFIEFGKKMAPNS